MGPRRLALYNLLQRKSVLQRTPNFHSQDYRVEVNSRIQVDEIMDRELRIPYVVSEVSLDLIRLMLDRDVDRRPTIEQVLAHPWFDGLPGPEEALLADAPIKASVKSAS